MNAVKMLKRLWRILPESFRMKVGARISFLTEPIIAASLPRASKRAPVNNRSAAIVGLFSSPIGLGVAADLLVRDLKASNISCHCVDATTLVGAPQEVSLIRASDQVEKGDALIIAMNPDIAFHALYRLGKALMRERRVIGYWIYELERVPPAWKMMKGTVHEIWTPTQFSARALAEAFGVPVRVVPYGVALRATIVLTEQMRRRGRALAGVPENAFMALQSFTLGSSLERKNALGTILAFTRAFANREDARLVIRYLSGDLYPESRSRLLAAAREAGPNVILVEGGGGVSELHDLYAACDTYISLHRCEGFGLNLAEAMQMGRPVIATQWSGNLEFMDETCAALVPSKLVPVKDPDKLYNVHGARWADPDIDVAALYLTRMADDAGWREKLSVAGRSRIKDCLRGGEVSRALQGTSSQVLG